MNVLLVALNARFMHSNLAVRYLRNECEAAGHSVRIAEFVINQNPLDIIERIVFFAPEVILFSTYIWNSQLLRRILPDITALLPKTKIILGGPEAGYNGVEWLERFSFVSSVVSGPGESAVCELAKNNFMSSDILINRPNKAFRDIEFPYRDDDFKELSGKIIYYESSRGCPLGCAYCISSRDEEKLDAKPAETVVRELDTILSHNPWIIKFIDRSFNVDSNRAREIWKYLSTHSGSTRIHFEIHPLYIEEKDIELLACIPNGAFQFEIGIQSINEAALTAVNRYAKWKEIRTPIERIIAHGNIPVHLDLIAGLPFDTEESFAESFNAVMDLSPDHLQLGFLKVIKGTVMAKRSKEWGIICQNEPPYQVLSTGWMSTGVLAKLRRIEELVESLYNQYPRGGRAVERHTENKDYYNMFCSLLEHADRVGFDITTKNKTKCESFMESFFSLSTS